ncbi:ABC transporter ATP-binding protein, partial [Brachybacterium tyrofermentans]
MKQTLRIVRRTLSVLPANSRRFLVTFGIVMSLLALLDVVALGAIAIVIPGLTSPDQSVTIPVVGWELHSFEEMMWLVGVFVVLIIVKSFLNLLTIRIATQ